MTTAKAKKPTIYEALKARQEASDPLPRVDAFDPSDQCYHEVAFCNECGEQGTATRPLFIHDAGCDEFIEPVGCHESCFQQMDNRSRTGKKTNQQEVTDVQFVVDEVKREARRISSSGSSRTVREVFWLELCRRLLFLLSMEWRKWDAVRKAEREEFTDFDDDVHD
jgi:hypothetical protein